ncbi:MAG: AAA family ATPase [Roseovarius sp.]|nr:AAA family ATPase [Roseovarius sp.]
MSAPVAPAPLKIITADERLKETRGIKGVLTGISGIGKTSQLWTLDPDSTLFLNLEAGELAVQGWPGDEIRIRDWERARDLACWIGGPNPAMREDQPYSQSDYDRVCAAFGDPAILDKYADRVRRQYLGRLSHLHAMVQGATPGAIRPQR